MEKDLLKVLIQSLNIKVLVVFFCGLQSVALAQGREDFKRVKEYITTREEALDFIYFGGQEYKKRWMRKVRKKSLHNDTLKVSVDPILYEFDSLTSQYIDINRSVPSFDLSELNTSEQDVYCLFFSTGGNDIIRVDVLWRMSGGGCEYRSGARVFVFKRNEENIFDLVKKYTLPVGFAF